MIAIRNPNRAEKHQGIGSQIMALCAHAAFGVLPQFGFRRGSLLGLLCATLLTQQACLWRREKAVAPAMTAPQVSILVLPLNTSQSDPTQHSLSVGSAVLAEEILLGVTDVSPVPLWRGIPVALGVLGGSRNVTPEIASDLANLLNAHWAMVGEIASASDGYALLIDFIPAKQTMIAFRYTRNFRPELLRPRVYEALGQFLRYIRHPYARLMPAFVPEDPRALFELAGALDTEYGWFTPASDGKSQSAFNYLAARDRDLAALLFNPGIYASGTVAETGSDLKAASTVPPPIQTPMELPPRAPSPPLAPEASAQVQAPARAPAPVQAQPMALPQPSNSAGHGSINDSRWAQFVPPPLVAPGATQAPGAGAPNKRATVSSLSATGGAAASSNGGRSERAGAPSGAPGLSYRLQVFASTVREEAAEVAENLRRAGVAAEITRVRLGDKRLWHRVRIGSYESPERASVTGDALVALGLANEYWIFSRSSTSPAAERTGASAPLRNAKPAVALTEAYSVQVFAAFEEEPAVALADVLRQAGLKVVVQKVRLPGRGDCYRVRLVGYPSRTDAAAAAKRLLNQGRISEYWVIG